MNKKTMQMMQMMNMLQNMQQMKKIRELDIEKKTQDIQDKRKQTTAPQEMLSSMMKNLGEIDTGSGFGSYLVGAMEKGKALAGYNPELEAYESQMEGYASPLARALMGEKGNLAEGDVERMKALFPSPYDTTQTKARKVKSLLEMLQNVTGAQGVESMVPTNLQESYFKL